MINSLSITSLNQGKLYGEKPTIDRLLANGAIVDERQATQLGRLFGSLFSMTLLALLNLFTSVPANSTFEQSRAGCAAS